MRELQRIRQAIREQNYRISSHANEEMSDDDLLADVEGAMLTGEITQKFTRDSRGTRYEVTGDTMDGHRTCGVCRFLPSGGLLIITAFVPEE
jgi:hypothetical protein